MDDHLQKLAISRAVTSDIIVPTPPGLTLKPYQRAGVAYMLAHKDAYFGDDMGLGKTIQTLGFVNYLRTTNPTSTYSSSRLARCPSTGETRLNVDRASRKEDPKSSSYRRVHFEVPKRNNLIVITNYEKLTGDTLLTDSLKRVWDVLVCDEAQALKNSLPSARWPCSDPRDSCNERTAACSCRAPPSRTTPRRSGPSPPPSARPSSATGTSSPSDTAACTVKTTVASRLVDTGATHLAELQQRLRASFMIRRLKSDVLKELPPKRRQLIVLGNSKVDWSTRPRVRALERALREGLRGQARRTSRLRKTQDEY